MPLARPETSDARVIAHVDMDCFYVQVEQRKQPELRGLPTAVVQYNEWQGGGLIAVSYEARKCGVKRVLDGVFRSMRGDEAKAACPEIQLVQVPVARGKADLNLYRSAGSEVVSILAQSGKCERASIDEVYLDLTDAAESMLADAPPESLELMDEEVLKSHILGLSRKDGDDFEESVRDWICRKDADRRDKLLSCGIILVAELRKQVLKETEFTCSAGIAHNKMLAKLASGMNKPAQQTVVPYAAVQELLSSLPIKKMKQLGGKLGTSLQTDLGVDTVGDLLQFSETKLQEHYGINTGTWLWNIARGISGEEVQGRLLPKSHGSGKTFPGPRALKSLSNVQHWLNQLSEELSERLSSDLEQNKRIASTLTLHASAFRSRDSDSHKKFPSKSCPLRYGVTKIQEDAFNLFQAALREYMGPFGSKPQGNKQETWRITGLSVSASKIVDIPSGTSSIMRYFQSQSTVPSRSADGCVQDHVVTPSASEGCSEQISTETQAVIPEEDTGVTYTFPNFETPDKDVDLVSEKDVVSCPSSEATDVPTQLESNRTSQTKRTGRKINNPKEKNRGMPSIVDIFKNYNASPPTKQETQEDSTVSPSTSKRANFSNSSHSSEVTQESEERRQQIDWGYKIDEIDQSVLNELPVEIQRELRRFLHPNKRLNTNSKSKGDGSTSSIAHYFPPLNR
ncbi:PREDICTED: DNA polymerase eta-like isoform X2 [Camelina sativa]|uniref:DNA polymerase eta n=1 Tax=Camelina sativa TaxID=90675 RepID=A0ABM1R9N6_CAMSA|nr:PREDICTED: DNA polymerase eta-like isoform X1 [Camelina sativa]XP_019095724.1 PREDICTED: DNA polymerase eta-like isoform X2 [Camelina sativa]